MKAMSIAVVVVFAFSMLGCDKASPLGGSDPQKFLFSKGGKNFLFPRKYIYSQGIAAENGVVESVSLRMQLPLGGEEAYGSFSSGDSFSKNKNGQWAGKFLINIGVTGGVEIRNRVLLEVDSQLKNNKERGQDDYILDVSAYGLTRYSRVECFDSHRMKFNPSVAAYIKSKPADDPVPESNCRAARGLGSTLFTNKDIDKEEEIVAIICVTNFCWMHFNVEGVGASIQFSKSDIPNWKEIFYPAQSYIRGFVSAG
ncbi:MAG: hypothetical protein ACRERR_09980 [Moraxellaceae bacterium]